MTTVHFYTIPDRDESAKFRFACKLAADSFYNGERTHIYTSDLEQAQFIDDCLWGYPVDSFVPHDIWTKDQVETFVTIGYPSNTPGRGDVLINVTRNVPDFAGEFSTIREIVMANERDAGRIRYSEYLLLDMDLQYINLNDWEQESLPH